MESDDSDDTHSYVKRQLALMEQALRDYELGRLSLNSLIQTIGALEDAIGSESLRTALSPMVFTIEEINAVALDFGWTTISRKDARTVQREIDKVRSVIDTFRRTDWSTIVRK